LVVQNTSSSAIVHKSGAKLPIALGKSIADFRIDVFDADGEELIIVAPLDRRQVDRPLIRIHSGCVTGDIFGSARCDCGAQLNHALEQISADRAGCVVYAQGQEGRGIGLAAKIEAYGLQDTGLNTVEANEALGFDAEQRRFEPAASLIKHLGFDRIRLITNNPIKVDAVVAAGVDVQRVASPKFQTDQNGAYLSTKEREMGHLFD